MKYLIYFVTIFFLIFLGINILILDYSKDIKDLDEISDAEAGLVLGASVYGKHLSDIYKDRLDAVLILYNNQKIEKILASGDHGSLNYDEVNTAKEYLLENGVLEEDIFLDHAGFDTYDSVYRAKEIFGIQKLIIVSQNFHLGRALYIASNLGVEAQGFSADLHKYIDEVKNNFREFFARLKAFFDVNFNSLPKFLGPSININGDGRQSWD
ncbi:MAG: ElyC/SanA/YdcF family protein [Candidatus Pacebacteria bacterium]|nr:ElyC/SanA/YdcF family protein [Candidatus Paceibacterota bacterium]MDD3919147.1 ElyC/SanA/YdcF family protein [Candidatus Paceibacterota bacterium]